MPLTAVGNPRSCAPALQRRLGRRRRPEPGDRQRLRRQEAEDHGADEHGRSARFHRLGNRGITEVREPDDRDQSRGPGRFRGKVESVGTIPDCQAIARRSHRLCGHPAVGTRRTCHSLHRRKPRHAHATEGACPVGRKVALEHALHHLQPRPLARSGRVLFRPDPDPAIVAARSLPGKRTRQQDRSLRRLVQPSWQPPVLNSPADSTRGKLHRPLPVFAGQHRGLIVDPD